MTLRTASSEESLLLLSFKRASTWSQKSLIESATIAFNVQHVWPTDWELPTALNSNLLPVKAKGDVLFIN